MKYYELFFTIAPCTQDARDVLSALAGEAGCETFEDTETGLKAYVQQSLFDRDAMDCVLEAFPFEGVSITYTVEEAEDRDWNEQWEQEGFEPIIVANRLVIHDGRHLPSATYPIAIEIDAHLAFGTGTHETTRMICATLLDMHLQGADVLDCGCGTGILGICALKLGAASCVGYDIDEWSTDNTRHNAVINRVDDRLEALCGDATQLSRFTPEFDVVLANINRNVLMADMPAMKEVMSHEGILILSGFYAEDGIMIAEKAGSLGLSLSKTSSENNWCMLLFNA
jgi:ribosomal protein L11 methyltransferase